MFNGTHILKARSCVLAAAILLSACTLPGSKVPDQSAAAAGTQASNIQYKSLDGQTFYTVLAAEMAIDRGEYNLASGLYYHLATETRDPAAAEKSAAIAQMTGNMDLVRKSALIWLETEPENELANETAALASIRLGDTDAARSYLEQTFAQNRNSSAGMLFSDLSGFQQADLKRVTQLVTTLNEEYPRNASLWYARARLAYEAEDLQPALEYVSRSIRKTPSVEAYLLKAQVYFSTDENDRAIATLDNASADFPSDRRLIIFETRHFARLNKSAEALPRLQEYLAAAPSDLPVTSLLARIAMDADHPELAETTYQNLLHSDVYANEAHFYLGLLAENRHQRKSAVAHLKAVTPSDYFLPANARLVQILTDEYGPEGAYSTLDNSLKKYPDQAGMYALYGELLGKNGENQAAFEKLTEGLKRFPKNTELLYNRALIAEPLGKLASTEQDLQYILKLDPENTAAMNALGYTWADNNKNLEEAYQLIRKAYSLNADDPATIDSMGWVYYRMGKLDKAIEFLDAAFSKDSNHEIAAHLGEVLYKDGRHEEADKVWAKGYQDNPDSLILKDTIKRLKGQ